MVKKIRKVRKREPTDDGTLPEGVIKRFEKRKSVGAEKIKVKLGGSSTFTGMSVAEVSAQRKAGTGVFAPTTSPPTAQAADVTASEEAKRMVAAINAAATGKATEIDRGEPKKTFIEKAIGFAENILKTPDGEWRTDLAGQFTTQTGLPVIAQPVEIGVPGLAGFTTIAAGGPKLVKGVGVLQKLKGLATFKNAFKTAALISGIDVLTVWFGADNRASTSSYYTNLVWDRYNNGEVSQAESLSRLSELEGTHKEAKTFIDYSTMLNPVLWAFRNFYMGGMEEQEVNMAENRRLVTETAEPKAEFFERTREEEQAQFVENQQMILEAQEAAEGRFADAQEERDSNKMAWAKEQALFYEALRKRNAGQPLTQEEIDLLWSWGINPNGTLADWDAYGKSNLNFGLIG